VDGGCSPRVSSDVFLKKHNATKLANVYVQALVIIRDKRKKNSPANVLALANIPRTLAGLFFFLLSRMITRACT
jgi:hypothetical protein